MWQEKRRLRQGRQEEVTFTLGQGLLDLFDGGGRGASGTEFAGGPFSGILNSIGVRPHGYADTMQGMENTRPQQRPEPMMQPPVQDDEPMRPMYQFGAPQQSMRPMARPDPMQYGPQQPMQYSGRGNMVPMAYPDWADEGARQNIDYLRSLGDYSF